MTDHLASELTSKIDCPIPLQRYTQVLLAHGGGGRLMHQLIEEMLLATFKPSPEWRHDAARLPIPDGQLAFTTDSYVVTPLFFPGGNIGSLAVHGTANDLAMAGARPQYLSLSFILEEGLPMETLWQIVQSIQAAAEQAQMRVVTGDTKVVDRGKGDGIFINTAGIGVLEHSDYIGPSSIQHGDLVLLSGDVGRHGVAILSAREGLSFETTIESDSALLVPSVRDLLDQVSVHCMRDLIRGGLASALNEIVLATGIHIQLDAAIPVQLEVQGACEPLGLDPFYVTNEGRFIAFVPESMEVIALKHLRCYQPSAQIIGKVTDRPTAQVTLQSATGAQRVLDLLSGEQLPRIC